MGRIGNITNETLTVKERLGEDASGNETYRTTTQTGYFEWDSIERRSQIGASSGSTASIMLAPDGYGDTWALKPDDYIIRADGTQVSVISAEAVRNPRTQVLHSIQVQAG